MLKSLIVGLGNPGEEYQDTRHNVGFRVLDILCQKLTADSQTQRQSKFKSKLVMLEGGEICLCYPQTFMNHSGQAVQEILNWYKFEELSRLLIVHDDISLPLGQLRWSFGRGAGGQHGVESVIKALGGKKDFLRLRVGIGPDPGGDRRSAYVLEKFRLMELALLDKILSLSAEGIEKWLRGISLEKLMSEYNPLSLAIPTDSHESK
ncbi:MAG: aminoacyl-tRNA hydrolase [Candidatus Caenarcaniphilales bacterium]|nr:aminoacyl-tRNA hydrolase [Candidatus Caenarcaniphilales bacterium]